MKSILYNLSFLCLIAMATSCDIINPEETIPAYIHIPGYQVITNVNQGTDQHRITDAWVGVDEQLVGAYFLPATFPVLSTGTRTISVFPGVIENGISSTREIYPFMDRFEITVDLEEAKIDTIQPITTYAPGTEFVFIEDFESSNLFGEDLDGNANTSFFRSNSQVFEGQGSGRMRLVGDFAIGTTATSIQYQLPKDRDIFLELHYKNEIEFTIGIIGTSGLSGTQSVTKVTLIPREDWNKVYISLDQEVGILDAALYQVFFQAEKPNTLEEANIYVDNIKLIY